MNFFDRNQIADVLRVLNQAEYEADQSAVGHSRSAAVAEVERRIDLDAQAVGLVVIIGVLNPRNDPLGDRKLGAACRITVNIYRIFDARKFLGEGQCAAMVKK